jgi:hypothetical protein
VNTSAAAIDGPAICFVDVPITLPQPAVPELMKTKGGGIIA